MSKTQFETFKSQFKTMLVRRYNWSVDKANKFSHPDLESCFNEGLSVNQSYFRLFKKEQDLQSD